MREPRSLWKIDRNKVDFYEVVSRINRNNQLVGYRIKDKDARFSSNRLMRQLDQEEWQYKNISVEEFKKAVKLGLIRNVRIQVDNLTGINGFKLRELPTEDENFIWKPEAVVYLDYPIIIGYLVRNMTENTVNYKDRLYKSNEVFFMLLEDISKYVEKFHNYNFGTPNSWDKRPYLYCAEGANPFLYVPRSVTIMTSESDMGKKYVRLPYLYVDYLKEYVLKHCSNQMGNVVWNIKKYSHKAEQVYFEAELKSLWDMKIFNSFTYGIHFTIEEAARDNEEVGYSKMDELESPDEILEREEYEKYSRSAKGKVDSGVTGVLGLWRRLTR